MTSSLPQHHSISVSSLLTPNVVTLHHALTPSLRSTHASKYVNWLYFTALIVLHRICWATAQGQQRHLLRRETYRVATAVTEVSVITSVLQSSCWREEGWMTAKKGFASEPVGGGGGQPNIIFLKVLQTGHLQFSNSQGQYFFFVRIFAPISQQHNNTNRHSVLKHMVPIHFMLTLSNGQQHTAPYRPI